MIMERQGSTYFPRRALKQLLQYLPTELVSMLPVTGNKEWPGPAHMLHYNVISGVGGGGKVLTLRLDIPISGTQPARSSSSLPTKPGGQAKTTVRKLTMEEMKTLRDPVYE